MPAASRVSVGTDPTLLVATGDSETYESALVVVRNTDDGAAVDLGHADVATGEGFELAAGQSLSATLEAGENLYAVAGSGTVEVHVLQLNRL
jgi:hypothetical protein